MINIYIGFDRHEEVAFHVLSASIIRRTSEPIAITPINLSSLKKIFSRELNPLQSTEFSFSRFLVPYFSGFKGWSIFMDCDMLFLDDIANLWRLRDEQYSVMCVKHDHKPSEQLKFLGKTQTQYEKKNWSSLMLLNNEKCTQLTLDYVNTASGLDLHRFKWLSGDDEIGEIPAKWNHLVDYDQNLPINEISNLHFTIGGPYFKEYRNCSYSDEWMSEFKKTVSPIDYAA